MEPESGKARRALLATLRNAAESAERGEPFITRADHAAVIRSLRGRIENALPAIEAEARARDGTR